MNYTFSTKTRNTSFILMAIGLLSLVGGFISDSHRAWPTLLHNSFFFMGIGLGALFFIAVQYAAEAGWSAVVKRPMEAIATFLPVGALFMGVVTIASAFHLNHIYHWADPHILHETLENGAPNPHYDSIIAGKTAFLNPIFFTIRTLVYLLGWVLFYRAFMKKSEIESSSLDVTNWKRSQSLGAWFLVFFAVTSSTSAWDWIMSIDTHWFSTMYGWYTFSGYFVSALTVITLLTVHLKNQGLLPEVTEHHIHDLGKFMFAFSIFWTYLWFSQFMLIWYANIPEEVTYFQDRFANYKFFFFFNLIINFVFPIIVLMTRGAKRNFKVLTLVGFVILFGHWCDNFVMIMPGTVKEHWHLGWVEIGTMLGFLGLFLFVVLSKLASRPVSNPNHVFYSESVHHHI